MIRFMIILLWVLVFSFIVIKKHLMKRKNPQENFKNLNPTFSDNTDLSYLGSLEYLEKTGAVQTNITGLNPLARMGSNNFESNWQTHSSNSISSNSISSNSISSNSMLNDLAYQEMTGISPTNITGLNPNHFD